MKPKAYALLKEHMKLGPTRIKGYGWRYNGFTLTMTDEAYNDASSKRLQAQLTSQLTNWMGACRANRD